MAIRAKRRDALLMIPLDREILRRNAREDRPQFIGHSGFVAFAQDRQALRIHESVAT